jgi:hypothetical protein
MWLNLHVVKELHANCRDQSGGPLILMRPDGCHSLDLFGKEFNCMLLNMLLPNMVVRPGAHTFITDLQFVSS